MTPALNAVYEELLVRAASPPFSEQAARLRSSFERRTGVIPPDHPSRPARDAASWEDALVEGGLGLLVAATFDDPSERSLAQIFARSQLGLFVPSLAGKTPCLRELWLGGSFVLLPRDDVGRSIGEVENIPFVGRIVAGADGCAVLPGRVWLPEDALPLLPDIIREARARSFSSALFCEAILWMEHLLATMSRIKPHYAFRPEGLDRRIPRRLPMPPTFPVRLTDARMISPSVRELIFARDDGSPLSFAAGQWLSLALPTDPPLRRSYSIASAPDPSGRFELAVTRVEGGAGSSLLHSIAPGAVLQATGPQGFFTRPASVPSLLVATGTGVTPLRSMILDALARGDRAPLALLLGVRREEDLLYRDEFLLLQRQHPSFSVSFTLSRPPPSWAGLSGYVQTHVPALWQRLGELSPEAPPHLFVCGLERMVKAVRDLLRKDLAVPRDRVHSERFD